MKIDRLVSIVMILLERKRICAQELADMFEVSLRTIYRDVDAINLAGIPIRSTPGVGGGFEIMPNYKVDKNIFSASDLSALLMGLSSVSGLIRGNELANALAKIKSFIPADKAKDIELKASQILVDLSPWMGNQTIQPYLQIIQTALQENKLLSFDYSAHHGKTSSRIVEPYRLVLKSNHWYFQGYCCARADYRLFKLSRMANLQLTEETFLPRNCEKPLLNFDNTTANTLINIKLRIHKSILDRVLDLCPLENFLPDDDDHFLVNFPFIENDYYYDVLLGFGNKCQCLEPVHIRQEIKRRILEMAKIYGK